MQIPQTSNYLEVEKQSQNLVRASAKNNCNLGKTAEERGACSRQMVLKLI